MIATALAAHRPSLLDIAAGDLVLRICNSSRDGQIVRLKSAKCTIGSGPHCTLRLRARGVSPLHCLIIRGPAAAVVRRWAADTRLNHQSFADAALSPGDRLSIGPIELEVVSVGVGPTTVDLEQLPEDADHLEKPPHCNGGALGSGQDFSEGISQAEADSEAELQRQNMEEESQRLDEFAASLQRHETSLAAQAKHLDAQQTELETQRQAMDRQRQQWQAEQDEAQKRLDEQREPLSARLVELEARQNALAEERRQWETQRNEAASQAAAQAEQLNARLAETQSERQALEQQQQQWQAEQTEAQRRLDQQRQDIAASLADLETQRNVLEENRRQWETQRAELAVTAERPPATAEPIAEAEQPQEPPLQAPQFQTPSEAAPVDLADVFRRVGAKVELAEEEEKEPAPDAFAATTERPLDDAQQPPAVASATSVKEEVEEESIDDYMSRLMQRIRSTAGDSGPAASAPPRSQSARSLREAMAAAAAVPSSQPQPASPLSAAQQRESATLLPRTVAPEKHIDLSALRELANLSAHSAISQHARQVLIRTMHSKLAVALMALATGGALLWMWKELGAMQMTYYSALIALLVAIYWGMEYALLSGRLTISKSGHIDIDWNASPHGKGAAPPAEDSASEKTPAESVMRMTEHEEGETASGSQGR